MSTNLQSAKITIVPAAQRLLSVDALRGFDMFWILGAEGLFAALFTLTGWAFLQTLATQMQHSVWHGITAYDLIFPLFIFLSGVSLGLAAKPIKEYSLAIRKEKYYHAIKRLFLLLFLGVVYNHGWGNGAPFAIDDIRYASVLGRIAIAWFVAAMLVWHTSIRSQVIIVISTLLAYWLLLATVTIDGYGGGNYSATGALNVWFDQHFLPGITYRNQLLDPEGVLSNVSSIINALIGVFAGRAMKQLAQQPKKLLAYLVGAGIVMLVVGFIWHGVFPINKSLWTSSFVLVTCGYSALLLALFYFLIDVLKWQRWATFFAVIGMNSIVIYLSTSLISWYYTIQSIFGAFISATPTLMHGLLMVCAGLLIKWLILYWLYQRKIFIKV
jgi:predicted acyltransferase